MQLKQIVSIQSGYQFRGKVVPATGPAAMNAVPFIQIKDVDPETGLKVKGIDVGNIDGKLDRYLVKQDDVLFLSRGHRLFATPIVEPLDRTIVTSYFFISSVSTSFGIVPTVSTTDLTSRSS